MRRWRQGEEQQSVTSRKKGVRKIEETRTERFLLPADFMRKKERAEVNTE